MAYLQMVGLELVPDPGYQHQFPGLYFPFLLSFPVDLVTLTTALEIFNEHDLQASEHVMDVVEVIHCLTALYERLEEERGILVNVPLCVDMSLNWLLNVFDR